MKNRIVVCLLMFTVTFAFAQVQVDVPKKAIKPRKVNKELSKKSPPGTVWLKENLYLDDTEIRNIDWLEYYFWMVRVEPAKAKAVLPDSLCWIRFDSLCLPFVYNYFRSPEYYNYPVVGITYAQALAYCQWRTDRVNEMLAIRYKEVSIAASPPYNDMSKIKVRVKYRLPTKEEWEYAAMGGVDTTLYPLGQKDYYFPINDFFPRYGHPASNTKSLDIYSPESKVKASIDLSGIVSNGRPNYYGYYNMVGNVQELVADSLVKGASFNHFAPLLVNINTIPPTNKKAYSVKPGYFKIGQTFRYEKPQAWLGFRCVAEVISD